MKLKPEERVDDLQYQNLKIIQNKKTFCFGIDAVLLSDFAKNIKANSTVIDLCSGNGIIAILLAAKTKAKKIYAVEIQEEMADMAQRSVRMNGQQDSIQILHQDLKMLDTTFGKSTIDAITVNPPYKKAGSGIINDFDAKTVARHEVLCTLEDILNVSASLLKVSGSLYMVHRTERLVDVLASMRQARLEPKRIRFIHPSVGKAPNLFMVEAMKNANPFLKVEEPLYVYRENGEYTETIDEIYHRNQEGKE